MRAFVWALRAFVFFTLFAFALNNQQPATVRWFFGVQWQAPMVFVVLGAFAAGCVVGVLAMAPHWWRQRRQARRLAPAADAVPASAASPVAGHSVLPSGFGPEALRRDGL